MSFHIGQQFQITGAHGGGTRLCTVQQLEHTENGIPEEPGQSGRLITQILREQGVATVLMLSYLDGSREYQFAALVYNDGTITDLRHQPLSFVSTQAA